MKDNVKKSTEKIFFLTMLLWSGTFHTMKADFSTFDVQKALGIPRERLRQWMDEKYISPSVAARGVGTRASFELIDVYRVALLDYLISRGFKRATAAIIANSFDKNAAECNYILVRREFGKPPRIGIYAAYNPLWQADLKQGTFMPTNEGKAPELDSGTASFKPTAKWSDIYIINFAAIKVAVDSGLLK